MESFDESKKFLDGETSKLNSVVGRQHVQQRAEFSRLKDQVYEIKQTAEELQKQRLSCIYGVIKIEKVLGLPQSDINDFSNQLNYAEY